MIRRVAAGLGIFLVASVALAAGDGKVLRFRQYSLMDPQGIGDEAASMLIPTDWKVEGGVVWRAHPTLCVCSRASKSEVTPT